MGPQNIKIPKDYKKNKKNSKHNKLKRMDNSKHSVFDFNHFWNIRANKVCNVCLMNPPFGTKSGNEHIDILFLLIAMKMTKECVYSLHKASTTKYLIQFLNKFKLGNNEKINDRNKDNIVVESIEIMASLKFDVPKIYKFHKQKSKDIQVSLLRIKLVH